jgi:fluoride exporter
MERLIWICIGGAAGTAARYGIALWASRFSAGFPLGTAIVNLVGCFAIALVMSLALALAWPATIRLAITVGVLGGFTTYSSFNYETSRLLIEGSTTTAALNFLVTTLGGLLAGWLGLLCARLLLGK